MKKKYAETILIFILFIVVIVLSIKIYYDKNHMRYYDDIPLKQDQLVAQTNRGIPVSDNEKETKDGFYVKIKQNHIDDGIFYKPKQEEVDRGFLIEQSEDGTFHQVTN